MDTTADWTTTPESPVLRVTSGGTLRGAQWKLPPGSLEIGRGEHVQIRIDDPTVSRRHARVDVEHGRTTVTDLGSTGGTRVNGRPVSGSVELRGGDRISLAGVDLEIRPSAGEITAPTQVSFTAGHQQAAQLNNVGGDQYHQYLQTVHAQRESFLREVAATKTTAWRFVWLGFALYAIGVGAFLWMIIDFVASGDDLGPTSGFDEGDVGLGTEIGGLPVGLIGFGVAVIGTFVMTAGIVLHIVAAARRRRVQQQVIAPPPQFSPQR